MTREFVAFLKQLEQQRADLDYLRMEQEFSASECEKLRADGAFYSMMLEEEKWNTANIMRR